MTWPRALIFLCALLFTASSIQPRSRNPFFLKQPILQNASPLALRDLEDSKFALLTEAGKLRTTKISDLGKGKILILDFWATWCGPCRRSIPGLIEIQEKYRAKGVEVLGLSVEEPTLKAKVIDFKKQFAINYPVGFASREFYLSFDQTRSGVIPQTFIFGRDGVLLKQIRGFHPTRVPQMIQETIDQALGETNKPASPTPSAN